jgi:methionine aminopeptidase
VELVETTRSALAAAIAACGPGVPFWVIGDTIQVIIIAGCNDDTQMHQTLGICCR